MSEESQLLWAALYCAFILLLFLLVRRFPPKALNCYYGYRTKRSMKNEATWKAAQDYSSRKSIQLGLLSFIFPVIFYFTYPAYNFLLSVIANTLLIILTVYATERYLKEQFEKNLEG